MVYYFARLKIEPMEIVHYFPGDEWRRVQRAEGYHATLVNGEVTFEDGIWRGATPGRLRGMARRQDKREGRFAVLIRVHSPLDTAEAAVRGSPRHFFA